MAKYYFSAVGTNETKTVKAKELLKALADDECVVVFLKNCVIEGEVDIAEAGIALDKNEQYPINKPVMCQACIFKEDVLFTSAQFSEYVGFLSVQFSGVNFSSAQFSGGAFFVLAQFSGNADFRNAQFSGGAFFIYTKFSGYAEFNSAQFSGVDFRNAQFSGGALFSSTQFSEFVDFRNAQFNESVDFTNAQFSGYAFFSPAQFSESVDFSSAKFSEFVDFTNAQFSESVDFTNAQFSESVNFTNAHFSGNAFFDRTKFDTPTSFANVGYEPDTFSRFRRQIPTQFYLDSQHIDEVSNPFFKRYVADQQFLRAFKKEHPILAGIWQWSSDYGRSLGLWAFWSVIFVVFYAFIYGGKYNWKWWGIPLTGITFCFVAMYIWNEVPEAIKDNFHRISDNIGMRVMSGDEQAVKEHLVKDGFLYYITILISITALVISIWGINEFTQEVDFKIDTDTKIETNTSKSGLERFIDYFHYSVVTFTTLGFNYDAELGAKEKVLLMSEVLLGYIILGGLISIFTNKLARRS